MTQLFHLHNEMTNELRKKRRRKRKPLINFTVVFFVTRHVHFRFFGTTIHAHSLTHSFFLLLQMIVEWAMVATIWDKLMWPKVAFHAKNGTHRSHISTFNRQMYFHKFKMPKTTVETLVAKNPVHGATPWMNRSGGNCVTFHYAVSRL